MLAMLIFTQCVVLCSSLSGDSLALEGCQGIVNSTIHLDFSQLTVALAGVDPVQEVALTDIGDSGYFFLPIDEPHRRHFTLRLHAPPAWRFEPRAVSIDLEDTHSPCQASHSLIVFEFAGFHIEGAITSSGDGLPGPSGVTVKLFNDTHSETPLSVATSSLGGVYTLENAWPGNRLVRASHPTWHVTPTEASILVSDSGRVEMPTFVVDAFSLDGHIACDGEPVGNMRVVLVPQSILAPLRCSDTDEPLHQQCVAISSCESGAFSFAGVAAGNYSLSVESIPARYHLLADATTTTTTTTTLNTPSSDTHMDVRIPVGGLTLSVPLRVTGFSLEGTVESSDGSPLANVTVFVNGTAYVRSNLTGGYTLTDLRVGTLLLSAKMTNDDSIEFDVLSLHARPHVPLPLLVPLHRRVCGRVILPVRLPVPLPSPSPQIIPFCRHATDPKGHTAAFSRLIQFTAVSSSSISEAERQVAANSATGEDTSFVTVFSTRSNETGHFCVSLPFGTYNASVGDQAEPALLPTKGHALVDVREDLAVAPVEFEAVVHSISGNISCAWGSCNSPITVSLVFRNGTSECVHAIVTSTLVEENPSVVDNDDQNNDNGANVNTERDSPAPSNGSGDDAWRPQRRIFRFDDLSRGIYRVVVQRDTLCWREKPREVDLNTVEPRRSHNIENIDFVQAGFVLRANLSHAVSALVEHESGQSRFQLRRGRNRFCLSKPGLYKVHPHACYRFAQTTYDFDTSAPRALSLIATHARVSGSLLVPSHGLTANVRATLRVRVRERLQQPRSSIIFSKRSTETEADDDHDASPCSENGDENGDENVVSHMLTPWFVKTVPPSSPHANPDEGAARGTGDLDADDGDKEPLVAPGTSMALFHFQTHILIDAHVSFQPYSPALLFVPLLANISTEVVSAASAPIAKPIQVSPCEGNQCETGDSECLVPLAPFVAQHGRNVTGRVHPSLGNVALTFAVRAEHTHRIFHADAVTDDAGMFTIGPFPCEHNDHSDDLTAHSQSVSSRLMSATALHEGYILRRAPMSEELFVFTAHRLANLTVSLVTPDQGSSESLAGVTVSVSSRQGGFRRTLVSSSQSVFFQDIEPGAYFVKPMRSEFAFEPASVTVNVGDGEDAQVRIMGQRVGWSARGHVRDTQQLPVVATVRAECITVNSSLQCAPRETLTDRNGAYRLRHLAPAMSYRVFVVDTHHLVAPAFVLLTVPTPGSDTHGLNFSVLAFSDAMGSVSGQIVVGVDDDDDDKKTTLQVSVYNRSHPRIASATLNATQDTREFHFELLPFFRVNGSAIERIAYDLTLTAILPSGSHRLLRRLGVSRDERLSIHIQVDEVRREKPTGRPSLAAMVSKAVSAADTLMSLMSSAPSLQQQQQQHQQPATLAMKSSSLVQSLSCPVSAHRVSAPLLIWCLSVLYCILLPLLLSFFSLLRRLCS